jgi:hypothetical protein
VAIELQKTSNYGDIERFRKYLAGEYTKSQLPIISIYILGFNLNVESPAFRATPQCFDLRSGDPIDALDQFVKTLVHETYFIQTLRIKPNYNSALEKLLAVYEQAHFLEHTKKDKIFSLTDVDPELRELLRELEYIAGDKELRKQMDHEEEYRYLTEGQFEKGNQEIAERDKKLAVKDRQLEEKDQQLEEKEQTIQNMINELKLAGISEEKIMEIMKK